jgi:hypothetical protein
MHFLAGGLMSFIACLIANYHVDVASVFILVSLLPTVIVGGAKELIYDKAMKKGYPDWMDFIVTVLGGIVVTAIWLIM